MDKNIFPPVKVTKEKTGYSVGVWNRTYKFDSSPLLYSMIKTRTTRQNCANPCRAKDFCLIPPFPFSRTVVWIGG